MTNEVRLLLPRSVSMLTYKLQRAVSSGCCTAIKLLIFLIGGQGELSPAKLDLAGLQSLQNGIVQFRVIQFNRIPLITAGFQRLLHNPRNLRLHHTMRG